MLTERINDDDDDDDDDDNDDDDVLKCQKPLDGASVHSQTYWINSHFPGDLGVSTAVENWRQVVQKFYVVRCPSLCPLPGNHSLFFILSLSIYLYAKIRSVTPSKFALQCRYQISNAGTHCKIILTLKYTYEN